MPAKKKAKKLPPWAKQEKAVKFTLRLPHSLWESVNMAAAKQDLSMQQVIVRALNEYTEKYVAKGGN